MTRDSKPGRESGKSGKATTGFSSCFLVLIAGLPILEKMWAEEGQSRPETSRIFGEAWREPDGINRQFLPWLSGNADRIGTGLHNLERGLERSSNIRRWVRSKVRAVLADWMEAGNERVVLRQGALVFREDLDYVAGPGFLDPSHLRNRRLERAQSGEAVAFPDPRPAIRRFWKDCREAGVRLVVAPLPSRAMLGDGARDKVWNNRDFLKFRQELEAWGVSFFFPFDEIPDSPKPWFLTADTHWTPGLMDWYAQKLAAFLDTERLDGEHLFRFERPVTVSNRGDLAAMLGLAPNSGIFGEQSVMLRPVVNARGGPWRASPDSGILILGDSFANIFSDETMGWGKGAGLAPHLALRLNQALDVVAVNGSAATRTREILAKRDHPLAGKRLVLWLFAARDLAFGNWRPFGLNDHPDGWDDRKDQATKPQTDEIRLLARLETLPRVIDPSGTPYAQAVINLKFAVVEVLDGAYSQNEILARFQVIRDRRLTQAAMLVPGRNYELILTREIPEQSRGWTLIDDTEAYHLDECWVLHFQER